MQVSVEFSKGFSLARLLACTKWFASLVFSLVGLISFRPREKEAARKLFKSCRRLSASVLMFFKLRLNLALKTALLWVVVDRFGFVVGRCGWLWVVLGGSSF